MTSAETGPYFPPDAEVDGEEPVDGAAGAETPVGIGVPRRWGGGPNNGAPQGMPTAPSNHAAPNTTATPVSNTAPAPTAAGPTPSSAAPAGPAAPPAPGAPVAASPATAPATAPAQPTGQPPPAPPPADQGDDREADPLVDPEMLAKMAPMAMMAGSALLPMIGSALSGLMSGGAGSGGGAAPGEEVAGAGMTPDAQQAMKALKKLESVYGEGEPTEPETKKLREETDGSKPAGSGEGAAMIKAKRLYQNNSAGAFNNLDKQLATYITGVAGSNKIDKGAVRTLLKSVNEALAELGPTAYTKEGQQKVRKILTAALKAAHKIVSGGSANNGDAASAINQLTNQYLYNILGKELPGGVKFAASKATATAEGGSKRAQFALKTALAQIGDPYVWGAEGPGSFDCSGLTQYAAQKAGVNIPRTADEQFRKLPRVKPGDIQPGDLIFPENSYKNGEMGHVMMYIGDGKCVHAPKPGKDVTTTSLPDSYAAGRIA
ncbi:NlpC/P60 family protein [Nocardia sp. NPDC019395]|uniref:C40 family peptidase n=1 Tax=Nocardia sp. NPDC019395 TaxID=3154686 RepID=UPI0033C68D1E